MTIVPNPNHCIRWASVSEFIRDEKTGNVLVTLFSGKTVELTGKDAENFFLEATNMVQFERGLTNFQMKDLMDRTGNGSRIIDPSQYFK